MASGLGEAAHGFVEVHSGGTFSMGLKADGTVWAWGWNWYGQLGDGTNVTRPVPVQIAALTGARTIALGNEHGLAIKADGTVWAWGHNADGGLGDGTTVDRWTPTQVPSLTGSRQLAAGGGYSAAIKADGSVWTWGSNNQAQLGDGTLVPRSTPGQVAILSGVRRLVLGYDHGMAIGSDGSVWSWGGGSYGQIGDGTNMTRPTPVQLPALAGTRQLALGAGYTAMALKADGTVWTWGYGSFGQMGNGTTTVENKSPLQIPSLTGARQIQVGNNHSMVLKADGTVWAWGWNAYGQLGNGTTNTSSIPVQVASMTGARELVSFGNHSLAIASDGSLKGWGANYNGQLGDGTTVSPTTPVTSLFTTVAGTGFVNVYSGSGRSFGVRANGTVWAWGANGSGQLGDGTTTTRVSPVPIAALAGVRQLAIAGDQSMAIKADGTVWAWGENSSGQLGDGTTIDRWSPVQIAALTGARQLSMGNGHSMAIMADGSVRGWGNNGSGQLGNGTTTSQLSPLTITALAGMRELSLGRSHSMGIASDGTVRAWGANATGQLGDGTNLTRLSPVTITSLAGTRQLAVGDDYGMAIKSNGAVVAWGSNLDGQLGDGSNVDRWSPVPIAALAGSLQLGLGTRHSAATQSTGTFWTWGGGQNGALGNGTNVSRNTPAQLLAMSGARQASLDEGSTLAIKADGSAWAWGWNATGQVGDCTTFDRWSPVLVVAPRTCDVTAPSPNPTTGSGVANSTTQITWTINPATDNTGGVGLHTQPYSFDNGVTWQASNVLVQSGLTANTQHSKTIRVRDSGLNMTAATTISRWTLVNPPTLPSAVGGWNATDGNRVALAWTAPVGGAASYRVRWSADAYASVQGSTAAVTFARTLLAANTSYTFKVCAANADGVEETTCTSTVSATTPPAAPGSPSSTAITDTSVQFAWTVSVGASDHRLRVFSDSSCGALVSAATGIASPYTQAGLLRDHPYWYRLDAFGAGAWGAPTACAPLSSANGRTSLTLSLGSPSGSLGSHTTGATSTASTTVTVQTWAATGHQLSAHVDGLLTSGTATIPATSSGTVGSPPGAGAGAWVGSGFGFTVASATNLEAGWGAGTRWARFSTTSEVIHATGPAFVSGTDNTSVTRIDYRWTVPPAQLPGTYSAVVTYTALATP